MTSAEFVRKYRLLKLVAERGARSHIAQEISLGRMVMVHRLELGTPAERTHILSRARRLKPAAAAQVFTIDEVDGIDVIVTHFIATFTDLSRWLDENAEPAADAVIQTDAPKTPASPPSPPGEFTRIFQGQPTPAKPATPVEASRPVASLDTPAPSDSSSSDGPGFTTLFGAIPAPVFPAAAAPPPIKSTPTPVASPPRPDPLSSLSPKKQDPLVPLTDFSAPPKPEPVAPPKTPDAPAAGDFTQLFERLGATTDPRVAPPTAPPSAPSATPLPAATSSPPAAAILHSTPGPVVPAANPGPSEFTRVLGRPGAPPAASLGPSAVTPPAAAASPLMPPAPSLQPPGMQLPSFVPPAVQPPTLQPPTLQPPSIQAPSAPAGLTPPPGAKKSPLLLIVGINVAVLLVILVVLWLILKK